MKQHDTISKENWQTLRADEIFSELNNSHNELTEDEVKKRDEIGIKCLDIR
jgi:hypothetical protein